MPDLAEHSDVQIAKWLRRERNAAYSDKNDGVSRHNATESYHGVVRIAGTNVSLGYWRNESELVALVGEVRASWWRHLEAEARRRNLLDECDRLRLDIKAADVRRSAPSGDDLASAPWSIGRAWIYWHGVQRVAAALGIKPVTLSHALVSGDLPYHVREQLVVLSGGRFRPTDFDFAPSYRTRKRSRT